MTAKTPGARERAEGGVNQSSVTPALPPTSSEDQATWRTELRQCDVCMTAFTPKREHQRHCSTRCRNHAAQKRHREAMTEEPPAPLPMRSDDKAPRALQRPPAVPSTVEGLPVINGRINGIFDTVEELRAYREAHRRGVQAPELEYYDDGYPKLPACLDRRRAQR